MESTIFKPSKIKVSLKYGWLIFSLLFFGILTYSYVSSHLGDKMGIQILSVPEEVYDEIELLYEKEEATIELELSGIPDSLISRTDSIRVHFQSNLYNKLIAKLKYSVEPEIFDKITSTLDTLERGHSRIKSDFSMIRMVKPDSSTLASDSLFLSAQVLVETIPYIQAEKVTWFWFEGNKRFLEVLYWGLIGVVCGLLFSVTQSLKKEAFNKKFVPDHIGRLVYGPIAVLIIYLNVDLLSSEEGPINIVPEGYSLIVFAFILGFYSRRTMRLLDELKKIILPIKGEKKTDSKSASDDKKTKSQNPYDSLSIQEKKAIVEQAKQRHLEEWMDTYDNIQSVTKGYKQENDQNTKIFGLIFQVSAKKDINILQEAIPEFIVFKAEEGITYHIPTDIEVVGETAASGYIAGKPKVVCTHSPYAPGCSISRKNQTRNTGTLGLKTFRDENGQRNYYLVSCYHVLCAPELCHNIENFKDSTETDFSIVAPSEQDGGGNDVGTIEIGYISDYFDAAIAKLTSHTDVSTSVKHINNAPEPVMEMKDKHENTLKVKMTGRTSNYQTGVIIENRTTVKVNYTDKSRNMQNIIVTSRLSDKGDSGAFVFDQTDGCIIGMVISGNNKYSYLLPAQRIFTELNIQPCLLQ